MRLGIEITDLQFYACAFLGSPALAFYRTRHSNPHEALGIGFIVECARSLIAIAGIPFVVAFLIGTYSKPKFRHAFVIVWVLVNALIVYGSH